MTGKDMLKLAQRVDDQIDRLVAFVDGEDFAPGRPILEKSAILLGYVGGAAEAHPELREATYMMIENPLARLRALGNDASVRN
jgi:hypothetical protein